MSAKSLASSNGSTQALKVGKANAIRAEKGQRYRIQETDSTGKAVNADNVIATRSGNDLNLKYADGTEVQIQGFYSECGGGACSISLPGSNAAEQVISAETAAGASIGESSQLVYAHGNSSSLMAMASGNAPLASALGGLGEGMVTYSAQGASAGLGTASESGLGIGAAAAGGVGIAAAAGGAAAAAAAGAAAAAAGAVVSGGVVAGKLVASHGLKVELYKADGVTLIATGAIDASGNYSVDIGSYRGIVITKIVDTSAGADFIDEATGKAVDLNGTLMSIGVVAGSTKMNVNPLTTVAAKKAGATNGATTGAPSDSDVAKYNASIAESFGLTDLIGIDVVTTQDGGYNPNNGVSAAEKLGAILAALSGMDQTAGAGNIDTAIDALANGITVNLVSSDGTLSGNVANLLLAGAKTADPNTSGSLTNLISDAVAQTNASVSINAIGSDNAIDATESAGGVTITGTTVTGATVALSIGGVTRAATVTGTTWSYTLVAGDYTNMGEDGETITATATLTGGGTATATRSIIIDTVAPTLTITSNTATIMSGQTATITFTFSDVPDTFALSDVSVTGGTLSNLASTNSAKVSTATFTPSANFEGSASITVASGTYTDAAGNTGGAGTTPSITIDTLAPTQTVSGLAISTDTGSSNSDLYTGTAAQTITATLSAGLGAGDILYGSANGGTSWTNISGSVSGTAVSWAGTLTAGANSIKLKVTDAAGNDGAIASRAYTLDAAAPAFTSGAAASFGTGGTGTAYTAAVTETSAVTYTLGGTDAALFNLNSSTGALTFVNAPVFGTPVDAGGNNVYDVSITATDLAGNTAAQAVAVTVLNVPTVTGFGLVSGPGSYKVGQALNFAVSMSEAVAVTGTPTLTLSVNGQPLTASYASGSGSNTLTFTATAPTGNGNAVSITSLNLGSATITGSSSPVLASTAVGQSTTALTVDNVAPTLAITSNASTVTSGGTATITFTFSEAPTGFAAADVVVTGGTLGTPTVTADPKVYTATFTPTTNTTSGSASITVASGTYTDAAGNTGGAATTPSISIDTVAPTLAITSNVSAVKVNETATITFTFSDEPTNFASSDIAVTGGTLTTPIVTADTKVYVAVFTPTTNTAAGNASITVASGAYTDAAGNTGGAGTTPSISIDTVVPTLAITSNVSAVKVGETATVTFTFSEAPTGFADSDITVTGGTLSAISGTGLTRTATFTPTVGFEGNASITVASATYTDAAGNAGNAGITPALGIDTLAPGTTAAVTGITDNVGAITGTVASSGVTDDTQLAVSGTLSGSLVVGETVRVFDGATYLGNAAVSGTTWTYADTRTLANAQSVSFTAQVADAAGNLGTAGTPYTATVDTVAPTLTVSNVDISTDSNIATDFVTNVAAQTITATLSGTLAVGETLWGSVDGGTNVTNITGMVSGTSITWTGVTLSGTNSIGFRIADAAGNFTANTGTQGYVLDTAPSSITISNIDISADSNIATDFVTNIAAQTITGSLSAGLAAGDVLWGSVNGGGAWVDITNKVSGTSFSWNGATLASPSGTMVFKVVDLAGNNGAPAAQAYTVDTVGPVFSSGLTAVYADAGTGTVYTAASNEQATYGISGTDAAKFSINASTGAVTFNSAPSYASPTDTGNNNVYDFTVTATDVAGNATTQGVAVTVVNAPSLQASALDNVTNFDVSSNIVLNYSESVTAVAGKYIRLINDGGTGFRGESATHTLLIEATSGQVSISNGRVTINPSFDLDLANSYHVEIDAGAFVGQSSGLATAAYDGTTSLNFSTVTPGTSALANAVASQKMAADGTLAASYQWLDIEGIGSPSGTATPLNLSAGNYALAAKDYDATGANVGTGYDGIQLGDLNVAATSFALGDLIYLDDQGNNLAALNDLALTGVLNDGAAPTIIQFAGTSLGGFVEVSVAGSTIDYDSIANLNTAVGGTAVITA